MTPDQFEELESLSAERDPQALAEALLAFGTRLERAGQTSAALELYRSSVGAVRERPLRRRYENRIHALAGTGPWQDRLEDLGRRFVAQATDPAMILSFAVAGGFAAWVRRASLASLALRGGGILTRGYGARLSAGTAAAFVEAPAFVVAGRFFRGLSSASPDAASSSWGEELAGAYLFLGSLKLGGFAGRELAARLTQVPGLRFGGAALGSLGGVYLGHRLQEGAGLRPVQDEANRWVDGVDAWLQMMAGARLLRTDPRGAFLEARLTGMTRPRPAPDATPSFGMPRETSARPNRFSVAASFEDASLRRPREAPLEVFISPERQQMFQRWGDPAVRRFLPDLEGSARLLGQSPEALERLCLRSELRDAETLEAGWARLHYMLRHSDAEGRAGHYLNWVGRLLAVESLRRGDMTRLDLFFLGLQQGAALDRLERIVTPFFPGYDLFRLMPREAGRRRPQSGLLSLENFRQADALPLNAAARATLKAFLRYQGVIDTRLFTELRELLRREPEWRSSVEAALLRAQSSPLAYLRVLRLLNETESGERLYPKVLELAEPETEILPYRAAEIAFQREFPGFGSAQDGFLADTHFSHYLAAFNRDWREARRTVLRALHETWAMDVIREVWPAPRPLTREDLLRALTSLDDPMTDPIARALRNRDFNLRILDDAEFNGLARRFNGDDRGDLWVGFTVRGDASYPEDMIAIRQVRHVSPVIFHDVVFERLVALIHEFEHHAHPAVAASPRVALLREEMAAHLRHLHFRARNGFPESVEEILRVSPLGLGMYLRDHVETAYLRRPTRSIYRVHPMAESGLPEGEGLR
ncbi:MAG: hypothetical protein IT572_08940 [Deltaproteobacteria bacterium]|nr:hypothetical protein [Deltaproteobacteria bacterium]